MFWQRCCKWALSWREGSERGAGGGSSRDGAGCGFVPLHLFIFPRYCNTAGVELPTTFLLRSLIPHSNRGCNLTMSQLPCVKAVDETICICIFKYKQKPNPNKHKSQFRSVPWSWITMWLFKLQNWHEAGGRTRGQSRGVKWGLAVCPSEWQLWLTSG